MSRSTFPSSLEPVSLAAASALLKQQDYQAGSEPSKTSIYPDPLGGAKLYINDVEAAALTRLGRLKIWNHPAAVWEDRVSALPGVLAYRQHDIRYLVLGSKGSQTPPFGWPGNRRYLDLGPPNDLLRCWVVGATAALESDVDVEAYRDMLVTWIAGLDRLHSTKKLEPCDLLDEVRSRLVNALPSAPSRGRGGHGRCLG